MCKECHEIKPLSEFYDNPLTGDYLDSNCKECRREKVREARARNPDHYSQYDKGRANLPHRVEAREEYQKTDAYRESHNRTTKKFRREQPKMHKARSMVNNAIRDGKLTRPGKCELCPCTTGIEAHHCDYDKPMDVMWLCVGCHDDWHRSNTPLNTD